MAMYLHYSC